jgi:hypothetical protein
MSISFLREIYRKGPARFPDDIDQVPSRRRCECGPITPGAIPTAAPRPTGSRNLPAITNLALFYNRELSEGEIAELDANPYRIFRQVPAIYLGVAAPIMGQGSPFVDGAWSGLVDRKIAVGY